MQVEERQKLARVVNESDKEKLRELKEQLIYFVDAVQRIKKNIKELEEKL